MTRHYRAIRLERFAPSFREAADIVKAELTEPGAGEISVRNLWCGVNGIFDTQIARNAVDYVRVTVPTFIGVEAVGVVVSVVRGVTGFSIGDAAATRFTGGYREANIGPESDFAKVPAATREWLTLASTGVSALNALEGVGQVSPGETVAISAAAGGLGHMLVQLAKLQGCHVVAVCGGERKASFVAGLGVDRVIDYKREDVAAVLAAEYPNRLDVAIDTVSGGIFDAFLDNLAYHGRFVVGGAAQDLEGRPESVSGPRIVHKLYYNAASVRGFMNGLMTERWADERDRLFTLYNEGRLTVTTPGSKGWRGSTTRSNACSQDNRWARSSSTSPFRTSGDMG